MQLKWSRPQSELQSVLYAPATKGPEITYWVFSEVSSNGTEAKAGKKQNGIKWNDMTVIAPGLYGKEFPKTYGHYHPPNTLETYKLISGDGIFLLQKKHIENGIWTPNQVDEVFLIKFAPGDEMLIPNAYGHSWSNVGNTPLLTFDDWKYGHTPTDYKAIETLHGMAFYLLNDNGLKIIPNPNYKNLPTPQTVTPQEFTKLAAASQTRQ
jgi:oxalate decarboxylase/phosphoglucose isomerase-like protein (cupin superfamily)